MVSGHWAVIWGRNAHLRCRRRLWRGIATLFYISALVLVRRLRGGELFLAAVAQIGLLEDLCVVVPAQLPHVMCTSGKELLHGSDGLVRLAARVARVAAR